MQKIIYILIVLIGFVGCGTKSDGFTNRFYNNKVGWFNSLFNGKEALKQGIEEKKQSTKDSYYEILSIEQVQPEKNKSIESFENILGDGLSTNNSSFARAQEKAIVTIKHHSIKIDEEERNKVIAEAYLVLGKARYYSSEFIESLEALNYIQDHLKNGRKKVKQEGKVYLALAHHALGNDVEAEEIFKELENQKLVKKTKKLVSKAHAQYLIDEKEYEKAVEALEIAYKKNKKSRDRIRFIQAQIYEQLGQEDKATEYYEKAIGKSNSVELITKSHIGLVRNIDSTEKYINSELSRLKKLSKKGLFVSKKNEILYAMGMLYDKKGDKESAEKYYKLALKENQATDSNMKAMNYLSVAEMYFKRSEYVHAGAYYDSASRLIQDPKYKKKVDYINKSMKEVIKNYYIVKKNDSILNVVAKTPEQRAEYYQDFITELKEKEEQLKKEEEKRKRSNVDFDAFFDQSTAEVNTKFYFYNETAKTKGITEFRKTWGNRPLGDNWRTSVTQEITTADDTENELLGIDEKGNSRRFELEYYLEKLPQTEKEVDSIKVIRDEAELNLGIDYYEKFDDKKLATKTLLHLVESPVKEDDIKVVAYYNLYKINQEINSSLAETYKNKVLNEFPKSKYANNILNPPSVRHLSKSSEAVTEYEKAYQLYYDKNYTESLAKIQSDLVRFPSDVITPKYLLLSAYCQGKLENKEALLSDLNRIVKEFPETKEAEKAKEVLLKLNPPKETEQQTQEDINSPQIDEFKPKENIPSRKVEEPQNLNSNPNRQGNKFNVLGD
ncbi:MAG: tetratricopeptide repeat protein [Flavobacteriales bacterium]|nr:tetratricopeptide repeat protein [Flavobacteriales bacterium]